MDPMRARDLPGFVARAEPLRSSATASGVASDRARLTTWGDQAHPEGATQLLSPVVRRTSGMVDEATVDAEMRSHPESLRDLLPPFAAMQSGDDGVTMVADSMGFRQLYHSTPGSGAHVVMASSALAAAREAGGGLDEVALGNQSLLGWQLGQRTLFKRVCKLEPGAVARLHDGHLQIDGPPRLHDERTQSDDISLPDAVRQAASLMRASLTALLDDHPDAVLQLTGGLDSRLLLSAIPVSRRRGLRAMTLGVPHSGDVEIASDISERYGIDHEVRGLADLAEVTPADAWTLSQDAARRVDAMCDPIALAALGLAEQSFPQGVRISGLGGEVARGFYYTGRVADRPYTREDAARLAGWRMFVNDAVEPGLLTDAFSAWARDTAEGEVHHALLAGGAEWFRATDDLYLRHRMQRWAGATDTAVSTQRTVLNPMLDSAFLDLATRLRPQDKAQSRFLSLLQMELDPDLGRMPLEGRPSPAEYAHPSAWWPFAQGAATASKFAKKAVQRLRRGNRPPAGGELLAAKVLEYWRAHPEVVAGLSGFAFIEQGLLAQVLDGDRELRPSSVALLTNLIVAVDQGAISAG
ncbi:hypothetical protein [Microbacterium aerolatum]|uniref:asparagine synthase (glutamine-hydrolyzing) n=1 Tax=Microbacterium aerolatum TaxID=153731 RepID=A0A511AE05_9MICO|nr:hypothetical protein [Microbacterium aerolatum]GEK86256.1 hypothetical protein MAE01_14320 [Microbacterium aerolatum]GGB16509.1 hypothetical protein GCM10007198_03860 [Microbacterium aerolatum]